ncbi:uncharacterized protein LOC119577090 isoform X2 [Penaeus monodon]|uniref:uncharacterized protein LOC119577090 isoform X2 n=1 Tax=Penaeus monodon TaxID=6687 RepID=UPI0018A7DA96|nr:uncharacterized protein LOC119577090 isoform X2 [Penaeus monodon]
MTSQRRLFTNRDNGSRRENCVFKDHDNNYWLDADGSVPFPENSVVYRTSTDFPGRYFADQELTVEWALEWLPRTVEVYPRRVLGKPVFAYQNFPAVSSAATSPSLATMSPTPSVLPPKRHALPTCLNPVLPSTSTTPSSMVSTPITSPERVVGVEPSEIEEAEGFTKNETNFFYKSYAGISAKELLSIAVLDSRVAELSWKGLI